MTDTPAVLQTRSIAESSTKLKFEIAETMTLTSVADVFLKSGFFTDVASVGQAMVKILAGREMGMEPVQAMMELHIVKGKIGMSAESMAAKVKGAPGYRYKVLVHNDDECSIQFYERVDGAWEDAGPPSTFTKQDAAKAQTQNMGKFPRNMLFARAMSNGFRWYCPDLKIAGIYTPEEINEISPPGYTPVDQAPPSEGAQALNDAIADEKGEDEPPAGASEGKAEAARENGGESSPEPDPPPAGDSSPDDRGQESPGQPTSYQVWLNQAKQYKDTLGEEAYYAVLARFEAKKANEVAPGDTAEVLVALQAQAETDAPDAAPAPSAAALSELQGVRKGDLVQAVHQYEQKVGTEHRAAYGVNLEDHSKSTANVLRTYAARLADIVLSAPPAQGGLF